MHSSSKEQEDKNRRLKKIDSAEKALEELIPKLNVYHLKTQKQITKAVNKICKKVDGLLLLYFFALMIVSLIERNIRLNMTSS